MFYLQWKGVVQQINSLSSFFSIIDIILYYVIRKFTKIIIKKFRCWPELHFSSCFILIPVWTLGGISARFLLRNLMLCYLYIQNMFERWHWQIIYVLFSNKKLDLWIVICFAVVNLMMIFQTNAWFKSLLTPNGKWKKNNKWVN